MRIDGLENLIKFTKFMRTKDYIKKDDIKYALGYGSYKTIRTYKNILQKLKVCDFKNKRGAGKVGIKMIEKTRLQKYELIQVEYALSEKLEENEAKKLIEKIKILNDKVF